MSSLLRSTKFVRYFAGAARTLLLNSAKTAEANLLVNSKTSSSFQNATLRDYATAKKTESLEPLLLRLDSEVRRFGRISKKDIDDVFDEIKAKSDISSSQSLLVIRCCGDLVPEELPEQRTQLVQKIWSVLTEIGVPMDISHYNALLRVYIENEHPFSPAAFLEELEKKGLEPNRVTYQRLMWRYCQEGDVDGATKVLERMRELGHPVSEPVLNALVMGHAFHGDTDGAKAVLETMAGAGLEPTNKTYALLATGYAKKGDIEGVENTIKTANEKEALMTNKDFLDIVEALATSGHGDKVDIIFDHIHKGVGYNQDVCNLILRLINKGQEEIAKKVMKTMPKSENIVDNMYKGAFFVKHLLKVKKSSEEIIKICYELQQEGLVPHALYIATETALADGSVDLSLALFKELKKSGTEIRPHYYWPLLVKKGREKDEEGLLHVLRDMNEQGLIPSGEALRDYVFPYLKGKDDPQNIMVKLQIASVPLIYGARNLVIDLLEANKIKDAQKIAMQYRTYGQYNMFRRPLVQALAKTSDVNSFVNILHVISSGSNVADEENAGDKDDGQMDEATTVEVGKIVQQAIRNTKPELHEQILNAVLSKGLRINTHAAEAIQQSIGENMTSSLSEALTKLTSSELELAPLERRRRVGSVNNVAGLERLVANAKTKGTPNNRLQRQLLAQYIKENNVEKIENYLKELEASDFELTAPTLAQLLEFYAVNNRVEKALEIKNILAQKHPDFKLTNFKLLQCAIAMVKADKFEEAKNFLVENRKEEMEDDNFGLNSKAWQLLNHLAETKDSQKVLDMTKALVENNYVEPSNVILGPSIKVHLLNDDIEGALKQFEYCCKQYRTTPWKGEIMKALIMKEDATKLQWVADMSTQIHGEVNILHDLVLAFVECGRLRQARRILETPGLHTKNRRLDDACKRYVVDGKPEYLEGLLEATKDLSNIDRTKLFYHLLVSYCKANETEKAVGLWTVLQEEGEVPSEEFLTHLGKYLKSKGQSVPFAMPQTEQIVEKTKKTNKNLQPTITKTEATDTINKLVQDGKLQEAMDYALKVMRDGVQPKANVLKFLLRKLADQGDIQTIMRFEEVLKDESTLRRNVTYDDKLTLAIFKNGNGGNHLENLSKEVFASKTNEQLENALKAFPRSNALASIVQNDEILTNCIKIVEFAASKNIQLPANLLWMELLLAGKDKEANELWNKTLTNVTTVAYRRLLQEAHTRNDVTLCEKLIKSLKTNKNITDVTLGNVYSRMINLHLYHNNIDAAKSVFEKAITEHISLDYIGKNSLQRLKNALEANGEEFKHPIPSK